MIKAYHCNICGAVLAISEEGSAIYIDDPMVVQHRAWHQATFASIDKSLGIYKTTPKIVEDELDLIRNEKNKK